MNLDPSTPVRDITTAMPASLRHFERWGIDYCCGGGRPLDEACKRAGVPVRDVLAELEALASTTTPDPSDFRTAPLPSLIEHIVSTHHVFTRDELGRALLLAAKVHRVHGAAHPELARVHQLVDELRDDLVPHMMREEKVLFPWILALETGDESVEGAVSVGAPIACMREEHEGTGAILHELRRVANDFVPPEDACGSYRALYGCLADLERDLHVHIHLENDLLFPRALVREAVGKR